MNAPMKPGAAASRAAAIARGAAALAGHVEAVERLLAARPAVSTREIVDAIHRSITRATTVAAAMGLRRSDEHPDHARTAPVYHARDVDTAIAAERAWVADRARRSPAAQRRQVEPARGPVGGSLEVVPLADVREPGDRFACTVLCARLSARTCVARQRSLRPECHVCRDCADGREVARRIA